MKDIKREGTGLDELRFDLEAVARSEWARLFGVAPVERFAGAPRGHHPMDFIPRARSVIVVGVPIPKRVSDYYNLLADSEAVTGEFRKEYLQRFFYTITGHGVINTRLEQIALSLTLHLEDLNIPTIYFPTTYGTQRDIQNRVPGKLGIFSNRHAAVRAGLGEFGLNNVVVTPEYGPRVRFVTLVTAADLEPTPLLEKKACLGMSCIKCVRECGPAVLKVGEKPQTVCPPGTKLEDTLTYRAAGNTNDLEKMVWYDPVSRTDMDTCEGERVKSFCYGKCLSVCPVGK